MARNDFNGDGRSDILWLFNEDVAVTNWLATASGGFVGNDANAFEWLNAMHHFQFTAAGDFNGDGRTDGLWLVDDDIFLTSFANQGGGNVIDLNDGGGRWFTMTDPNWTIVGSGDFNGDGIDDLLWQHANGMVGNWLGTNSGNFIINGAHVSAAVSDEWRIAGLGDFDGDGRDDILWQSSAGMIGNWFGTATGDYIIRDGDALESFGHHAISVGDFNGDGRDDLLWRAERDEVYVNLTFSEGYHYLGWGSGFVKQVSDSWDVVAIGDYNGDGTDDILWRHDDGYVGNWLGTAGSGYEFTINDGPALVHVPNSWQVADMF